MSSYLENLSGGFIAPQEFTSPQSRKMGETSEVEVLPSIDVIANRDLIIKTMQDFLAAQKEISNIRGDFNAETKFLSAAAYRAIVSPLWGTLRSGGNEHNLFSRARNLQARGLQLEGHNVLSDSEGTSLKGCVIEGVNALSDASDLHLEDSFVLGHNALSGPAFVSHMHSRNAGRNITIVNSVVYGHNALDRVKSGTIKNSIIGGYAPLSDAAIESIRNTYIVSRDGVIYVEDGQLGNTGRLPHSSRRSLRHGNY